MVQDGTTGNDAFMSIIIPVYNVHSYLPCLFRNLQEQDLTDTEVLFIDDGSTDGSGDELDHLAAGTGFTVIHQDNAGVAAARNHGLDTARGEYLCFIDPDDAISERYIHNLRECARTSRADLLITDWRKITNGLPQPSYLTDTDFPDSPAVQRVITEILQSGRILGSLWAKAFSARLFEDNRFPEQRTSSDYLPTLTAISNATNIRYVPDAVYEYTSDRPTSLQNNQRVQDIRDSTSVHEQTASLIRTRYPELSALLRFDLLNSDQQACIHICRSSAISDTDKKTLFNHYRKPIMHEIPYLLKRKGSLKYKLIMISIALGYYPTNWLLRAAEYHTQG